MPIHQPKRFSWIDVYKRQAQAAAFGEAPAGEGGDEISGLVRDADAKIAAAKIQPGARVALSLIHI